MVEHAQWISNPDPSGQYNILLPVSDSRHAAAALAIAAAFVQAQGGQASVLGVVQVPEGRSLSAGALAAQRLRSELETLVTRTDRTKIVVQPRVRVTHHPWEEISEAVRELESNLLLLPLALSGPKNRTSRAMVCGVPVVRALQAAPCDVALVKGIDLERCRHILLPIRGGPYVELALRTALALAAQCHGEITVLHGVEGEPPWMGEDLYRVFLPLLYDLEQYIKLAERWFKWEAEVGPYRQRKPIIDELCFTDGDGHPLDFTLTSYPHLLHFETAVGVFEIAFLDQESLYFKLPLAQAGLQFKVYADRGRADRRGGELKGHRNIAYTTNARLLSNTLGPHQDGYLPVQITFEGKPGAGFVLNITPRLGFNRAIPPCADDVFATAARRWHAWFAAVPPVDQRFHRQYYYAWWVMRAGLLSTRFYLTREAMTPSKIHYVGVWQWDAFFHALAYRYVDARLAEDQLRVVLDHQQPDGMVPDAIHDEGIVTHLPTPVDADVTKPPLIGWAALKLYEGSGNRDFLDEIYEPIVRWNRWWFERNDDEGDGIVQYNHPYSSGLDDSPLWDAGMPVESPDLNTYLVLQMEALSRIAAIIGEDQDAPAWAAWADALVARMIAHFWDEEAGVFWATRHHQPIQILTPFSLYPLWTGRLPRPMVERLVTHLTDPAKFWTPYPIPTVARSDPHYDPNQMWRGPTWVNINYIFIEALMRNGYDALARELRTRTLDLIMAHDDIYEYYHPETGAHPAKAASIFGWSSAVFIDLAIQASRESGKR